MAQALRLTARAGSHGRAGALLVRSPSVRVKGRAHGRPGPRPAPDRIGPCGRAVLAQRVLLSVQTFAIEEIGIRRRSWSVDAPGLWIRIVHQEGMGVDERLVRLLGHGRPATSRNLVGLLLDGSCVLRLASGSTRESGAGDVTLLPGRASYSTRGEAMGPSFSLTIELDREVWGSAVLAPSFGRMSDPSCVHDLARSLCGAIERAWADPVARPLVDRALGQLFAYLRADGLPLPDVDTRAFASPPATLARLGRAVDRALSQTHSRAMLVDVENDGKVCARTVQRALPALCAVWGQTVESFKEHTRRCVLARATWAMTNPKATTELVGRAVGFSTPNAFCRAMASYDLPSPGRVRQRFIELA